MHAFGNPCLARSRPQPSALFVLLQTRRSRKLVHAHRAAAYLPVTGEAPALVLAELAVLTLLVAGALGEVAVAVLAAALGVGAGLSTCSRHSPTYCKPC